MPAIRRPSEAVSVDTALKVAPIINKWWATMGRSHPMDDGSHVYAKPVIKQLSVRTGHTQVLNILVLSTQAIDKFTSYTQFQSTASATSSYAHRVSPSTAHDCLAGGPRQQAVECVFMPSVAVICVSVSVSVFLLVFIFHLHLYSWLHSHLNFDLILLPRLYQNCNLTDNETPSSSLTSTLHPSKR